MYYGSDFESGDTLPICLQPITTDFMFICNGVLTTLIVACGLAGNIYSFANIRKLKSCSSMFMALIIADTSVIVSALGFYALPTMLNYILGYIPVPMQYVSFSLTWITGFGTTAVSWLLVVILRTQCAALNSPLQHNSVFLTRQTLMCVGVLVAAGLYSSVRLTERRLVDCVLDSVEPEGLLNKMVFPTMFVLDWPYLYFIYHVFFQFALVTGGPLFWIAYYGWSIVKTVRSSRQVKLKSGRKTGIRKNSAAEQRDARNERHISKMMLMTAVKFMCSRALPLILNISNMLSWAYDWEFEGFEQLAVLSNLLVVLHSSTNWLYHARSRKPSNFNSAPLEQYHIQNKTLAHLRFIKTM